jgi:hypothetical protein
MKTFDNPVASFLTTTGILETKVSTARCISFV